MLRIRSVIEEAVSLALSGVVDAMVELRKRQFSGLAILQSMRSMGANAL